MGGKQSTLGSDYPPQKKLTVKEFFCGEQEEECEAEVGFQRDMSPVEAIQTKSRCAAAPQDVDSQVSPHKGEEEETFDI